jgi:hypothetical protein
MQNTDISAGNSREYEVVDREAKPSCRLVELDMMLLSKSELIELLAASPCEVCSRRPQVFRAHPAGPDSMYYVGCNDDRVAGAPRLADAFDLWEMEMPGWAHLPRPDGQ